MQATEGGKARKKNSEVADSSSQKRLGDLQRYISVVLFAAAMNLLVKSVERPAVRDLWQKTAST